MIVSSTHTIVKSPILMGRPVVVAFVGDNKSYYLVFKFMMALTTVILFVLIMLGYSPVMRAFRESYW